MAGAGQYAEGQCTAATETPKTRSCGRANPDLRDQACDSSLRQWPSCLGYQRQQAMVHNHVMLPKYRCCVSCRYAQLYLARFVHCIDKIMSPMTDSSSPLQLILLGILQVPGSGSMTADPAAALLMWICKANKSSPCLHSASQKSIGSPGDGTPSVIWCPGCPQTFSP